MKHIILAIIIMVIMTATVNAKPLSLNCDGFTDTECSCVAGYVTLAYDDLEIAIYIRDKGMSSLTWLLNKSLGNCLKGNYA